MKKQMTIVTADDILQGNGKIFFIGGNQLPIEDIKVIFGEATTINSLYLWKLLLKDLYYQGYTRMREAGNNNSDLYNQGWALVHTAEQLDLKIKKLMNFREQNTPKEKVKVQRVAIAR